MSHTALQGFSRNGRINFQASVADERRLPERDSSAASTACSAVSVDAVEQALWATGHRELHGVQIEIVRGIVVLWGCVPTSHLKHLAQVTAERVVGIRRVANGLDVDCGR